jgi:hypothetical protein
MPGSVNPSRLARGTVLGDWRLSMAVALQFRGNGCMRRGVVRREMREALHSTNRRAVCIASCARSAETVASGAGFVIGNEMVGTGKEVSQVRAEARFRLR